MLNVEEQTTRLEQLYRQMTGSDPKRSDQPISPIPPESNPEQYVQENLQRLQLALQGLGVPSISSIATLPSVPPRIAIFEGKDDYRIAVELPGVKKSDLNVEITQGILRIRATRGWPGANGETQRPIYAETMPCVFERAFPMPPFVKFDTGQGKLENGVLNLRMQKDPSAIRKDVEIEVA